MERRQRRRWTYLVATILYVRCIHSLLSDPVIRISNGIASANVDASGLRQLSLKDRSETIAFDVNETDVFSFTATTLSNDTLNIRSADCDAPLALRMESLAPGLAPPHLTWRWL